MIRFLILKIWSAVRGRVPIDIIRLPVQKVIAVTGNFAVSGLGHSSPTSTSISQEAFDQLNINIFPNPASDLIAVQINGLLKDDLSVRLFDMTGRKIESKIISKGQTIAFFETESLYDGTYLIVIENGNNRMTKKVVVNH